MEKSTGVTFADVAGQDEAKESLVEIIDFLHNPEKYTAIGAKLPKGALLVGSPGTGKTLLAKAVAGEANVPFFSISGSDFVEMFVGVGASPRARPVQGGRRRWPPASSSSTRSTPSANPATAALCGGNDEREQTLNQLLAEMDGFDPSKGVIVLAATNRPEVLDKALLRPGRFDRRITVDRPEPRRPLGHPAGPHPQHHAWPRTWISRRSPTPPRAAWARTWPTWSTRRPCGPCARAARPSTQEDLLAAFEFVIAGAARRRAPSSPSMKRSSSPITRWATPGGRLQAEERRARAARSPSSPTPRAALGYTMHMPEEDKTYLRTRDELLAKICRPRWAAARPRRWCSNTMTTGASNDIERGHRIWPATWSPCTV